MSLLPLEPPILLLDAATPVLTVGLQPGPDTNASVWRTSQEEAGIALFRETAALFHVHQINAEDLRTVVFCEGPGSLLGIRLVAMALRTWMALPRRAPLRVLAYRSLALVAADLISERSPPPFHVLMDARRESWNLLTVSAPRSIGEIRRCATAELPRDGGTLFYPAGFPHWQPLPEGIRSTAYRPRAVLERADPFPGLRDVEAPDAFMTEMPAYRPWKPGAPAPESTIHP